MGLAAGDADLVARLYGLGSTTGPMRPAARGELGRVWRLPTAGGVVAVKELFLPPTEDEAGADVEFQLAARRAGVLLPSPVRRTDGRVLAVLPSGVTVRVYEWMELRPVEDQPDERVGAVLASLHLMSDHTTEPRHPWFVDAVGRPAWAALQQAVTAARAPFAAGLSRLVPELVGLEELLPCPVRGDERRCHLDLDDSNLAWDDRGQLVILDWENSGPASPVSELAMVAAEYGPDRAGRLYGSYRDAGGPARLRAPTDFATAVAVQGHLIEFYARRWLTAADPEDRHRSQWRMDQHLDAPLTRARIADVLAAVRRVPPGPTRGRHTRSARGSRRDRGGFVGLAWTKESPARWDEDKQRMFGPDELASVGMTAPEAGGILADAWWHVTDEDGTIVGYGWLDNEWGDARITFLVDPARRGAGLGDFIVGQLEAEAGRQGLNYIYNVVPDSHPDPAWMTNWLASRGFTPGTGALRRRVQATR